MYDCQGTYHGELGELLGYERVALRKEERNECADDQFSPNNRAQEKETVPQVYLPRY